MAMSNAARIELEKRIVRGLIRHMKKAGFSPFRVNDGGEMIYVDGSERRAMNAVFAVDESSLRFAPTEVANRLLRDEAIEREHGVLLICGNGIDIISDWTFTDGDPDGFNAAMDAYSDKVNEIEGGL
jgi:hypothetical protein